MLKGLVFRLAFVAILVGAAVVAYRTFEAKPCQYPDQGLFYVQCNDEAAKR